MSDPNFEDVLDVELGEVEKPVPKPAGTYLCVVMGMPEVRDVESKKTGEKWKSVSINLKAQAPLEDVDMDALNDPKVGDISSWPPTRWEIFGINTPEGLWQLKQALTEVLGIDVDGKKIKEALAEVAGHQVKATMKHEPYMDRNGQPAIAWRVGSVAKA